MKLSDSDKELYRHLLSETKEQKQSRPKSTRKVMAKKEADTNKGFKEIAGMQELKALVTESFINVLKYRRCAEVYGIKPPSMLLWGPCGCGKPFFIEKLGDELGILLIKIKPDDV